MKDMQRFIFSLMTMIFIAASIPSVTNAQNYENTPVTISKEKVKINGQVCYSHIVLEKQTLYSISKAYDVTLEDLYRYNPDLKEKGLQKNSILIIPIAEPVKEPQLVQQPETEDTIIHIKEEPKAAERIHVVKWYEDLYTIAKKYGVSEEAIMKANGLKNRKISKRLKLIIPDEEDVQVSQSSQEEVPAEQSDSIQVTDSTSEMKTGILENLFFPKKEVSLSLIMPFKATGTSGSTGNMDFYSGTLLAVYDMAEAGTSCNVKTYDIAGEESNVSEEDIKECDVVIGPVSASELKNTLELSPKAVVSPLDQKAASLTKTFSNMIQAPTPLELQYKDLIEWIDEDMQYSDRFIVITEKGGNQTETTVQMKAVADSSGLEYRHLEYSILEGRSVTSSLEYIMTESGTNRVYIASDSEAFVNDVVRNLNLMIYNKYQVVLYAPSRIRNYETIEVENFHNTSLHVSTGYYIDYNDPRVQEFLLKYRALYNTEPTQFAFQGYDLARYFIEIISKYGNKWTNKLENSDASMLQSTYRFRRSGEGGYVNTGVRRIVYEDGWVVKKVR